MTIGKIYKFSIQNGEITLMGRLVKDQDYDGLYSLQTADGKVHKVLGLWVG